jgi:hypothetical protein
MTDLNSVDYGKQEGEIMTWSGDATFDMSADAVSDWMKLQELRADISFEMLRTGSPVGTFTVEVSNAGPEKDLNLAGIEAVTGTYAGSLSASNLRDEDLGSVMINLVGLSAGRVRVKYNSTSGTGTGAGRVRMLY